MFTRGITCCVVLLLAALVGRGVGGENGPADSVLMRLWSARKAEDDAGAQIIKAMENNNVSSFALVKETFDQAARPQLRSHARETVYTGWCWNSVELESPERSSLNTYVVDKKLRVVPVWDVNDLEIGTAHMRARHHELLRGLASDYNVIMKRVSNSSKLSQFKSFHDSWVESNSVDAFQLRDHDSFSGAGFAVERLCTQDNGCGLFGRIIPRGETLNYCVYTRTIPGAE
ncbi:MAG: hypothetical protein HYR96_15215 [Deltaproteobacteria bacterium]|nr:hypothetical protein [Deltaproteobacteria bacterium]MBI3293342.1 hypothetical protein [Deltaproteobacteria bacterium]